jgi:hypothetical protein
MKYSNLPDLQENLKDKVKNKTIELLKIAIYDFKNDKISIEQLNKRSIENNELLNDNFIIEIVDVRNFKYDNKTPKEDQKKILYLEYQQKINEILDNKTIFFESKRTDGFDESYDNIFHNIGSKKTSVLLRIVKDILKETIEKVKSKPHYSILEGKSKNEILAIKYLWLAWEINKITPHGYGTNSNWRTLLFKFKEEYILKAIDILPENIKNIKIYYFEGIIYFEIDNLYQISFHGKYDCSENIKCIKKKVEWIGFKTQINPLSINKSKIEKFNNYKKEVQILNNKYNLKLNIEVLENIVDSEVIVLKIENKIEELKSKYKLPKSIEFEKSENYYTPGIYFKTKIIDDKNSFDTKDILEKYDIKKYDFWLRNNYNVKKTILIKYNSFYRMQNRYSENDNPYNINLENELELKKLILHNLKLDIDRLKNSADELKKEALQYKTKTALKRINLLEDSNQLLLLIEILQNNIEDISFLLYKKCKEAIEIYKFNQLIDKVNNELEKFYNNLMRNEIIEEIEFPSKHKYLGKAKDLEIIPEIKDHDMIAECKTCGTNFSYLNEKKENLWKCNNCNSIKKIG